MSKWIICVFSVLVLFACTEKKDDKKELHTTKNEVVKNSDEFSLDSVSVILKKNPSNVSALTERSKILLRFGKLEEGLSDISKAYRLDSTNTTMRLVHASYMLLKNKILEARNDYNYIISKNPSSTDSYLGLAKSYIIPGNYDKAFEYINEALKKDQYLKEAYLLKGYIYRMQSNLKLAISSYQTAVQIDPKCYEGFIALGSIYEQKEDSLAYQFYQAAFDIDSNGMDALYGKALYLQYHNDIETAQHLYRKMTQIDSMWVTAYYNQGWIKLVMEKDYDSSSYFFLKTLELSPKYADAWYNLGLSNEYKNNNEKAKECFNNVLKIDPDYKPAREELKALIKK